jgi:homoserine dehydrogenase
VGFEASVCGGVPIIRALRSGLTGDAITGIRGVLNGTCNFILSSMEDGLSYEDALAASQRAGFAEADPSLDVDGHDSLQKLMILCGLAFGDVVESRIRVNGVRDYPLRQIRRTLRKGGTTRLVAEARMAGGVLELSVEPQELDADDPLGRLRGAENGVALVTEGRGELLLTGLGAGGLPTASAVLTDVIEVMAHVGV